jgi:hypothetical protein
MQKLSQWSQSQKHLTNVLSQTSSSHYREQYKTSKQTRVVSFVAKNRNGPDGLVFDAFVDWSDVTIQILDRDESAEKMQSTTRSIQNASKKNIKHTNQIKIGAQEWI